MSTDEIKFLKKMSKFKDNFSSESFYPDSNYYLDQNNAPEEDPITEDQKSNIPAVGRRRGVIFK